MNDAKKWIHAFMYSCTDAFISQLDNCNAMYTGLPKGSIAKLQLIQSVSMKEYQWKQKGRYHITPVLIELLWPLVQQRILKVYY